MLDKEQEREFLRTKGGMASTFYTPIAKYCLPNDAYDVMVIGVALHMSVNPQHRTRPFTEHVQEAVSQIESTGFAAKAPARWLDPFAFHMGLIVASSLMMVSVGVFTILFILTLLPPERNASLWRELTVFLAAYGLFILLAHMGGFVRALFKL